MVELCISSAWEMRVGAMGGDGASRLSWCNRDPPNHLQIRVNGPPMSPALLWWQSCHQATTRGQCEFERARELQKPDEQKWREKPQIVLTGWFFFPRRQVSCWGIRHHQGLLLSPSTLTVTAHMKAHLGGPPRGGPSPISPSFDAVNFSIPPLHSSVKDTRATHCFR